MYRHLSWFPSLALLLAAGPAVAADKPVAKFARFLAGDTICYGVVEGETVRQIRGDLFGAWERTDKTYPLAKVKLLPVTRPAQVLALAGNYKSHLGTEEIAPKFQIVQPFHKPPACLVGHGDDIVIPDGTNDVHYEAELVVVIGKRAKDVPVAKAKDYVFGVTCGNDVSARDWQKSDVQWWRAKGCDTFGPVGPYIVTGLDYDNLMLQLRLNGEVKQKQSTKDLIHPVAETVSFISRHTTLEPGDLIFTGTPAKTSAIKPGDVVEVEIEGIGVLRNPVRAAIPAGK
jgi:2-keto-4-pentenoate hydratase/2-oxohepta-3-ene-1,7-dioic acid hydratase in catechol pathway